MFLADIVIGLYKGHDVLLFGPDLILIPLQIDIVHRNNDEIAVQVVCNVLDSTLVQPAHFAAQLLTLCTV